MKKSWDAIKGVDPGEISGAIASITLLVIEVVLGAALCIYLAKDMWRIIASR